MGWRGLRGPGWGEEHFKGGTAALVSKILKINILKLHLYTCIACWSKSYYCHNSDVIICLASAYIGPFPGCGESLSLIHCYDFKILRLSRTRSSS